MFDFSFIHKIKKKIFPFYKNKDLKFVFNKLHDGYPKKSKTAMFVGGCVRKYLSYEEVDDIDIATSLTINQIKKKFKDTKFQIIDSGIKHGTVTLVTNKLKLELTTLRKDIKTDGRHAEIEFTDDWQEDSERRDITINAIYLDINGKLYDYQSGVNDLKKNIVKFIGDPSTRIQEDYLRIIRFLRFAIQYDSNTDSQTIEALKLNLVGIKNLSKERVLDELFKIIKLENFHNIFKHKNKKFIFSLIFPELKYIDRLNKLTILNKAQITNNEIDTLLSAMLIDKTNNYEYFCHKYKTSNSLKEKLGIIFTEHIKYKSDKNYFKKNLKKNIYLLSKEKIKKIAIFLFLESEKFSLSELLKILKNINDINIPKFSFNGQKLKNKGFPEGKEIGATLKKLEEDWIENDFNLSDEKAELIINKARAYKY